MPHRILTIFACVAFASLLVGCGKPEPMSPPTVHLGADVCARCGMMVSEERFIGALVVRDETGRLNRRLFDDVGEMLMAIVPSQEHRFYIIDFDTSEWTDAEQATFVHSRTVMTPMATGVVAFATKEEASAFAQAHQGKAYSFVEARQLAGLEQLGVDESATAP